MEIIFGDDTREFKATVNEVVRLLGRLQCEQ